MSTPADLRAQADSLDKSGQKKIGEGQSEVEAAKKLREAADLIEGKGSTTKVSPPILKRANPFFEALKESGGTMSNEALMEGAKKHGSKVKQADAVTTYLKQDPRFEKVGRGEWRLSSWGELY